RIRPVERHIAVRDHLDVLLEPHLLLFDKYDQDPANQGFAVVLDEATMIADSLLPSKLLAMQARAQQDPVVDLVEPLFRYRASIEDPEARRWVLAVVMHSGEEIQTTYIIDLNRVPPDPASQQVSRA